LGGGLGRSGCGTCCAPGGGTLGLGANSKRVHLGLGGCDLGFGASGRIAVAAG
jgi:hypothetical protein